MRPTARSTGSPVADATRDLLGQVDGIFAAALAEHRRQQYRLQQAAFAEIDAFWAQVRGDEK